MNPVGSSGGLALWWTSDVVIQVNLISKNILDGEVQFGGDGVKTHVSWVYGDSDFRRRTVNWAHLRAIGGSRRVPWLMLGDFNDISHSWEKEGGWA